MNEPLFTIFFAATIFDNLFDKPVVFKNVGKNFIVDILTQSAHRSK